MRVPKYSCITGRFGAMPASGCFGTCELVLDGGVDAIGFGAGGGAVDAPPAHAASARTIAPASAGWSFRRSGEDGSVIRCRRRVRRTRALGLDRSREASAARATSRVLRA